MTTIISAFILILLVATSLCSRQQINPVPGYPANFSQKVWSGYLNTQSPSRQLFYVFVQSQKQGADTPLTLWLNGGPGCSSLLGFLQQIGPYYLEQGARYKPGKQLKKNQYSWHKHSHLLFIQSPAGVGYSRNTQPDFQYSDLTTADDNIHALVSWFKQFDEYSKNPFWLAGQSYAGKYIPDLAIKIDQFNVGTSKPINLQGLFVGNGVMTFQNGDLQKSQKQFMIDRDFIDPDLLPYYHGSCSIDPYSAGCRYFNLRYIQNVDEINPYNVYGYCYYKDDQNRKEYDQASILKNIVRNQGVFKDGPGNNGAPCSFFDGMRDYFKAHQKDFHANQEWYGPCAENITAAYHISIKGSMDSYRYLLAKLGKYQIVLYSGDWDDVVPYSDTRKNIQRLNVAQSNVFKPFFAQNQHAGWIQVYDGLTFAVVKGASHQVPQSKPAAAQALFMTFVQT